MQNGGDNYKKCKLAQTVETEMPPMCDRGHEWRWAFWQPYGAGLQYPFRVFSGTLWKTEIATGVYAGPPPCFMVQVRAATLCAQKKECRHLFRMLVELELLKNPLQVGETRLQSHIFTPSPSTHSEYTHEKERTASKIRGWIFWDDSLIRCSKFNSTPQIWINRCGV